MTDSQEADFLAPEPWAAEFLKAIYPVVKTHLTAEQRREIEAFRRRQERLKVRGLLDDNWLPIKPTDCPRYVDIAEDWSERCQLTRGHEGPHRVTFERTTP